MNRSKSETAFNNTGSGNRYQRQHSPPNFDLLGYEMAFGQWLRDAKDFRQFKVRITEELQRFGFSDWAYSRLDIPVSAGIEDMIGTTNKKQIEHFRNINCYGTDLTYEYIKQQKKPVFRSKITELLRNSPLKIEMVKNHYGITDVYESFKFYDHFSIPLHTPDEDSSHANFICSTRDLPSDSFIKRVDKNREKLGIIVNLTEEIGIEKYSENFLGNKRQYDKIMNGRPIKLLETMAKNDCGVEQAAKTLHMSRTAADKQLAKIRQILGVSTTHGALLEAIKRGFISADRKK